MKDPGSAITHLIAMVSAAIAAVPLLIKAAKTPGYLHLAALAVFILSMICLYGASTLYHTLNISPVINKRLRKLDHMMIFVLIAGTYTPVCLIVLGDHNRCHCLIPADTAVTDDFPGITVISILTRLHSLFHIVTYIFQKNLGSCRKIPVSQISIYII